MLVQRISGILSACNMQIRNSKLCESSKGCLYSAVNHPWLMSMLFPLMGFAVAWLSRSLQFIMTRKRAEYVLIAINMLGRKKVKIC